MKTALRDVRAALATVDAGTRNYDVFPSGKAQLPAHVVGWPVSIDLTDRTLGGASILTIPITVVVALGSDATASQRKLDELINGDLQTALDAITPAPWQFVHVLRFDAFRSLSIGENTPAIAADAVCQILA